MKRAFFTTLLMLSIVYSTSASSPLIPFTETKLFDSNGFSEQQFGRSLAADGNTIVVGAPNQTVTSNGSGAVFVYVKTTAGWQLQQKLTPSDPTPQNAFGMSVAIDNDTIVVGAHAVDSASGAAYVFVRSGNTWTQQQKLTSSENSPFDSFGLSVAVKGDRIVCGAFGNSDFNTITWGSAYVFTRAGNIWTETQKLAASDASDFNRFGLTVALSEDTIVVGADGNAGF